MAPKPDQALEQAMQAAAATPPAAPVVDPNVIALAKAMAQEMFALQAGQTAQQQDFQRELVDRQAAAHRETVEAANRKPENANPPLVSDMNPKGERDHPKPAFPYPFFDCNGNAEIAHHQATYEECELLVQLVPGHYLVEKSNGQAEPVSVVATRDSASGEISKMQIFRRTKGEFANDWPPLVRVLEQMIGVAPSPMPERAVLRPKFGRVAHAGSFGTPGGGFQSLKDVMEGNTLSPTITSDLNRMLGVKADALEPSLT
jgi:hypothetical protein